MKKLKKIIVSVFESDAEGKIIIIATIILVAINIVNQLRIAL